MWGALKPGTEVRERNFDDSEEFWVFEALLESFATLYVPKNTKKLHKKQSSDKLNDF